MAYLSPSTTLISFAQEHDYTYEKYDSVTKLYECIWSGSHSNTYCNERMGHGKLCIHHSFFKILNIKYSVGCCSRSVKSKAIVISGVYV